MKGCNIFGGIILNFIRKENIHIKSAYVSLSTSQPLKVVSSAVHNPGVGMYRHFVNRTVGYDYNDDNPRIEMNHYLEKHGFNPKETVGMMTAVLAEHAFVEAFDFEETSIVIMVTAGVSNAVDITGAFYREDKMRVGTINTWVFVNGELSDEAFFQAMIAATEAKVKTLFDENIMDPKTGTMATGTSTDSVLIAATQTGHYHQYAGSLTPLGTLIGQGVYQTMRKALIAYKQFKEEQLK